MRKDIKIKVAGWRKKIQNPKTSQEFFNYVLQLHPVWYSIKMQTACIIGSKSWKSFRRALKIHLDESSQLKKKKKMAVVLERSYDASNLRHGIVSVWYLAKIPVVYITGFKTLEPLGGAFKIHLYSGSESLLYKYVEKTLNSRKSVEANIITGFGLDTPPLSRFQKTNLQKTTGDIYQTTTE